jgi:hypothetical protein
VKKRERHTLRIGPKRREYRLPSPCSWVFAALPVVDPIVEGTYCYTSRLPRQLVITGDISPQSVVRHISVRPKAPSACWGVWNGEQQ